MSENGDVTQSPVIENASHQVDSEAFKKARESGEERGYRRAKAEYEAEMQKYQQMLNERNQANHSSPSVTESDMRKIAEDYYNQQQNDHLQRMQAQQAEQIANNYVQNVHSAKPDYEDFEDVVRIFDPSKHTHLTYLLSNRNDAGHILYDLSKNPSRLANMVAMSKEMPEAAMRALDEIGQSIQSNRTAAQEYKSREHPKPLPGRDLQSSNITGGNGKSSISELRKTLLRRR